MTDIDILRKKTKAEQESSIREYLDGVETTLVASIATKVPLANIVDEDNMASDSASLIPTQQSTKAYADSKVSDTTYGVGWDNVTTIAPSKNTVYDKIETLLPLAGGTMTGTITLLGVNYKSRTEINTYNVVTNDCVIICNKATAMTINLQAASGSGRFLVISNIGAGMVTVDGNSSDTIDGLTTQTLNQYDSMEIVDYAANKWKII